MCFLCQLYSFRSRENHPFFPNFFMLFGCLHPGRIREYEINVFFLSSLTCLGFTLLAASFLQAQRWRGKGSVVNKRRESKIRCCKFHSWGSLQSCIFPFLGEPEENIQNVQVSC